MVHRVDVDEEQFRLRFLDIACAFFDDRLVVDALLVIHAEGVAVVQDESPFGDDAGLGGGPLLLQDMEEGRLGAVLRQEDGLEDGAGLVVGDARGFRGRAVQRGCPVGTADGGTHRAFAEGVASFLHLFTDEGDVGFLHAPGAPAVHADDDDMPRDVFFLGLQAGRDQQRGCQNENLFHIPNC